MGSFKEYTGEALTSVMSDDTLTFRAGFARERGVTGANGVTVSTGSFGIFGVAGDDKDEDKVVLISYIESVYIESIGI